MSGSSAQEKLALQSRFGNAPQSGVIGPLVFQGVLRDDDEKYVGAVTTTAEKVKKGGMDEAEATITGSVASSIVLPLLGTYQTCLFANRPDVLPAAANEYRLHRSGPYD